MGYNFLYAKKKTDFLNKKKKKTLIENSKIELLSASLREVSCLPDDRHTLVLYKHNAFIVYICIHSA